MLLSATPSFASLDWAVLGGYFALTFAVALFAARSGKTTSDSSNYFLAGRNIGWFIIGASLFASNIGSEHLVGLAGAGAESGVPMAQFEILASFMLLLLGWIFAPFYLRSGVFTMPEFLERRYSAGARWYLATISVIAYVLTKISVTIIAGGIVFETLLGIPFWTGAITVVLVTGAYTVLGGLRAVLYTDMAQGVLLIGGSIVVTVLGLQELGGTEVLKTTVDESFFSLWRPMTDKDFPWTGVLFGAPILGVWYWCTDQFIVQRVLSAKNLSEARRGTIFAGVLKLLPLFIFVIPGIIALALKQQGKLSFTEPNQAFSALVGGVLPAGLKGLVAAGLLAALMSSLSSVFNSCSTLVTWDLYRKMHPKASERQLVTVGQLATGLLVLLGLAWIPLVGQISKTLYGYMQSVQAYISPPIAAVFLFGILSKRVNSKGAMAALWTGFVLGAARLVLELQKIQDNQSLEALHWYVQMNFLHFAIFLFVVCSFVLAVVSLATPPPPAAQLAGLTFKTTPKAEAGPKPWTDLAWTAALILAVLTIWLVFR